MGKPKNENSFKLIKSEDMDVYVTNELVAKGEKLEVSMEKFLWKKYLNVGGVSL